MINNRCQRLISVSFLKLLLFVFFLSLTSQTMNAADDSSSLPAETPQIDKAFISFRIGQNQSLPPDRYQELLDLFDRHKGVTDEISFFLGGTHSVDALEKSQKTIAILSERIRQAHQRGYPAGINILCTIGHHTENIKNVLKGDYTNLTDIYGEVSPGTFCPNNDNHKKFVHKLYTSVTQAKPDFIWLDDDIRLAGHLPIISTCFCDRCIQLFAEETGIPYTRETLKKAANEGAIEDKLKVRKAWLAHNRKTLGNLFTRIEKTVHGIDPDMALGFMTGVRYIEGFDFAPYADILAGSNRRSVRWRPGGGFYDDGVTAELANKSHDIGKQVSQLPDYVVNIQSEIENFPYQKLKKAINIVVLEACSHIAAGCTGAAFNVLSAFDEPLDEYEPLVRRLHQARPFFDLMVRTFGRSDPVGVQTFWHKDTSAVDKIDGEWFGWFSTPPRHEFYSTGLPACYSNDCASVMMLYEDCVYALSRDEIESMLAGSVYMDPPTLKHLNAMGFGHLTGFEVVRYDDTDRIEQFTDHPLNGPFAGRQRDPHQSFWWKYSAGSLRKTHKNAQILAELVDYDDEVVADCTMGVFENSLGGRICVAGYYPWTFLQSLSKSTQIKTLFRWLSKDTLPGYIASHHKINLWIRDRKDGKAALAMTNSSFDPAENLVLMLRTTEKSLNMFDMNCRQTVLQSVGSDGPYQKFIIPRIGPWQIRLIVGAGCD